MFFELDDKLKKYRDYKQMYLRFNKTKFESKDVCEERLNEIITRLSNGPMEGFNRIPKDVKRNGRGYKNFECIHNRLIFSNRKDVPILAISKSDEEVHSFRGKKRGSYKTNK